MRLYQTWKNYLAQAVLQWDVPVLSGLVRDRLVDLHSSFFVDRSERDGEARRARLDALFDRAVDMYLRALAEGYPEAEAREITHIVAAFDFANHGWGELLEIPPSEHAAYYDRYRRFFTAHGVSLDDPLGEFAPPGGLPDAPTTPERMNGEYPFAQAGFVDDVYVYAEADDARVSRRAADDRATPVAAGGD